MRKFVIVFIAIWVTITVSAQEEIQWDYIDTTNYVDGVARACVGDPYGDGQWGLVDKNGNTVLNPKYGTMLDFKEGFALITYFRRVGYINTKGIEVVSAMYDVGAFNYNTGFQNGFAVVSLNDKFGFVNKNGKLAIPARYSYCWSFDKKGYAVVWTGTNFEDNSIYKGYMDYTGGKSGVIDTTGNTVLELGKYEIAAKGIEGQFIIKDGNKRGVIDYTENTIIPSVYDKIEGFNKGYQVTQKEKYGMCDATGKIALPIQYDRMSLLFYKGKVIYCVSQSKRYCLIDESGKALTTKRYEAIGDFVTQLGMGQQSMAIYNRVMCKYNGKIGWMNIHGEEVIACQYDAAKSDFRNYVQDGIVAVAKKVNDKYKWGVIDINGQIVLPLIYDRLEVFSETIKVELNNKIFVVDKNGNKIQDLESWYPAKD
jgi:hypothetical protein